MPDFGLTFVSLTDAIAGHARWSAAKTALVCGEQRLSWGELNREINRVANGLLHAGLRKGDKVGVLMANGIPMIEVMLGVLKAGGVVVPLSPLITGTSLALMLNDSNARFMFAESPFAAGVSAIRRELSQLDRNGFIVAGASASGWRSLALFKSGASDQEPSVRSALDDDFNIIYSSGTTGTPKGIVHTHYARMQFCHTLGIEMRFDASAIAILTTPLYANGTWMMLLPTLAVGGTVIVMPQFDPATFLRLVARERGTHSFMVPPQFAAILACPELAQTDTDSLRVLVSAGAPLTRALKQQLLARFGGTLMELYGLTEGVGTTLKAERVAAKLASVGTPVFGADIRILDDAGKQVNHGEPGEIVGYSSALMSGYHGQPDKTAEAMWRDEAGRLYLKTGDIGRLDEDGFLYILDRKKDMIISGGVNVFPSDIEEVLRGHPDVKDVTVIGIPDDKWGETPLALVVRQEGAAPPEDALKDWANERLAKHQRVSAVEFRDTIPRVPPLGKVPKKDLRAPYWQRAKQ